MVRRAQGALEYLLLVGGAILFVIIALAIVRGGVLSPANRQLAAGGQAFVNVIAQVKQPFITPTPTATATATATATPTPDTTPPQSNSPPNATYVQGSVGNTIPWVLTDNAGAGFYRVTRNGAVYLDWTAWTNNTNLAVPVDTSALGTFNYTITYNDSSNNFGVPNTVFITVVAVSGGVWVQTTQADFAAGTPSGVDLVTSPGDVLLAPNTSVWNWQNVTPALQPPARNRHPLAFDSSFGVTGVTVLFGGLASGGPAGDTWLYNSSSDTWTNVTPAISPPPRFSHPLAFDSKRNVTVLFDGAPVFLADTWLYNASSNTWTNVTPAVSPSARSSHALAFDSGRGLTVLFGGRDSGGAVLGDTWLYNSSSNTWTNVTPAVSPSARAEHDIVFDSGRGLTVLFGGIDSTGTILGDTWVYNSSSNTWTNVGPVVSPPARRMHSMDYDSTRRLTVLFSGLTSGGNPADTWVYNSTSNVWTEVTPVVSPAAQIGPKALAFDSFRSLSVLFATLPTFPTTMETWWLRTPYRNGTEESQVFDAGANATWLNLTWAQILPASTNVRLNTRSCTTAACTAVAYSMPPFSCGAAVCSFGVTSPAGRRFFQWNASLSTADLFATPVLQEVNVSYSIP